MPQFPVTSPVAGVNRVVNREGQPPGTCWDAVNVFNYDRYGRHRIAQRHGLAKFSSTQLATTKIQGMIQVPGVTYAGTTSSTVLTPVTFSHTPATVGTSTGQIAWPTNYLPPGGDPGVVVSNLPAQPWTLQFNLVFTGSSTANAANNLYLSLSNGSTSWNQPVLGNDPVDVTFQYNPHTPNILIDVSVNNTLGFSDYNNTSTAVLPFSSSIPCSLAVDGVGHLSAAFGNLTPTILNIGSTATSSSTMQLWADNPTTGAAVSTNSMNFVAGGTVATGQTGYKTLLVTVAGGNVFFSDVSGTMTQIAYAGVPSTARINSTAFVSMAYANGIVFVADGSSTLWSINTTSTAIAGIAASTVSSTTPVNTLDNSSTSIPPNCSLVASWRGRIVLAGDSLNPQTWYMSRVPGQYFNTGTNSLVTILAGTDWGFGQTDPAAAVAGNNPGVGNIYEPITALIPFSNDYLKFGCAHSLYMAQGDPAGGGNIVCVSQDIGVVGKDAWTVDPDGTLWFVATGGLYRCRPAWEFYRPPEAITTKSVDKNFVQLDPGVARTTLVYDPDLHFLHIFMTAPPLSGTLGQHLTLDTRSLQEETGPAFWPQQFPSTMGPTAAIDFYADANPNNRTVLIGGNDGYVRKWIETATDDDGTAISSGLTLGPFNLAGPGEAAIVQGLTIDLGETPVGLSSTNFAVDVKLFAGPDAFSVTEFVTSGLNPKPFALITLTTDRRQKTFRQRMRGGWFSIALASDGVDNRIFSFESAVIDFIPAGKNRERRQ